MTVDGLTTRRMEETDIDFTNAMRIDRDEQRVLVQVGNPTEQFQICLTLEQAGWLHKCLAIALKKDI